MKVVVYGPDRRVAAQSDDGLLDLNCAYATYLRDKQGVARAQAHADAVLPARLGDFIDEGGGALDAAAVAIENFGSVPAGTLGLDERPLKLGAATLHAPLASAASRLAMAGGNYAAHLQGYFKNRMGQVMSDEEAFETTKAKGAWGFWKLPRTVIGPNQEMVYPQRAEFIDYEGEVAVVIGRRGRDIPEAEADAHIWGYTLINDWTIFGGHETPRQLSFNLAKNWDTSCSLGPAIAVDEAADVQDIEFETRIDGELRQKGNTRDMVFSFAEYIALISRDLTLEPGDIISGGSPAGTAGDSSKYGADKVPEPDLFIHRGQEVEIWSPGVGTLRNRVTGGAHQ